MFSLILLLLPLVIFSLKIKSSANCISDLAPRNIYKLDLKLDILNSESKAYIKSFLPIENERQTVLNSDFPTELEYQVSMEDSPNNPVQFNLDSDQDLNKALSFEVECKSLKYKIPEDAKIEKQHDVALDKYMQASAFIQSDDKEIIELGKKLTASSLTGTLRSNFDYVEQLPVSYTTVLTDASRALRNQRASCNGKSRLLVAICRSQGIPARVAGGIILESKIKKTTHLWAEIFYQDNWIPMDALNGHFAFLPDNYLELYKGDEFLFRYSKELDFDYVFEIERKYRSSQASAVAGPNLWALLHQIRLPFNLLRTILLLPVAALLITIFRNVIGIKTFGVLLPALIGLALVNINFITGSIALAAVILIVSLLHFILSKWSLLHIPQLSIILTTVVIVLISLGLLGSKLEWMTVQKVVFLPIVILALTAERFAKTLVEENTGDAFKVLSNTLFLALLSCLIFNSGTLLGLFMSFPEFYLSIILIMLILGRWIGMRLSEFKRFSALQA